MNIGAVLYVIGRLCVVLAGVLAIPWAMCLAYGGLGSDLANAFAVSAAVSLGLGLALRFSFEFSPDDFGFGEAFATVTFVWVVFTGLGALPFLITGEIREPLDAFFEVLSGYTTTGSSILPDPSQLPPPLLFWRALTQWIGGLGIVALSVAILPALGAGGNFLFQAEVPGPESEKLLPRISSMAKLLWALYLGLTASEFLLLWAAGMTPFDAICHAFTTVSTGGFGTKADSATSFSPAIQWILIVFMTLSGINFVMLLSMARGHVREVLRNSELRLYALLMVGVTLLSAALLIPDGGDAQGLEPVLRDAAFTTSSLITSTGFATADYELWPVASHALLLMIMFVGGCAGSTAGGAKVIRAIIATKLVSREFLRLLRPRAVFVVKVGGRPLRDELVFKAAAFLVLHFFVAALFTLLLALLGNSLPTALSAAVSSLSNIGPGLGAIGPTQNFAGLGDASKLICMVAMLLGRLEYFSVLVLFMPLAWRR